MHALSRARRNIHHAIFHQSRQGRASEIAAWSNGASAVAIAATVSVLGWERFAHPLWLGALAGVLTLVVLRLALAHRSSVWFAASLGTLTIASLGGLLAWLFAHMLEIASAPPIAAVAGALVASLAPAWSYAQLAQRRANHVRDSLIDPVSSAH